jgi:diaminopimelate decarboxylase
MHLISSCKPQRVDKYPDSMAFHLRKDACNSSSAPELSDDIARCITEHRRELPTPFYLYSQRLLREATTSYRGLFPAQVRLFYSLKANPQVALVREFFRLGVDAEIGSEGEWQACTAAGVAAPHVVVGGVSKSEEFLSSVCRSGPAAIVLDSIIEWRRLQKGLSVGDSAPILLRINPGISLGGLNMAGGSQFGLDTEQALAIARECSTSSQAQFLGLHFYFGSQRLMPSVILEVFEAIEQAVAEFRKEGPSFSAVNLGLGIGVPYLSTEKALDFDQLREELHPHWQKEVWQEIELWAEAGRALVAASGYFIARVMERKRLNGKNFLFLDGGLGVHNPGIGRGNIYRRNPEFHFITDSANDEFETVTLVGNLCTPADTLGWEVKAPRLEEGDLVIVANSGAYCATTGALGFNSQRLFSEGLLTEAGLLTLCRPQYTQALAREPSNTNGTIDPRQLQGEPSLHDRY